MKTNNLLKIVFFIVTFFITFYCNFTFGQIEPCGTTSYSNYLDSVYPARQNIIEQIESDMKQFKLLNSSKGDDFEPLKCLNSGATAPCAML